MAEAAIADKPDAHPVGWRPKTAKERLAYFAGWRDGEAEAEAQAEFEADFGNARSDAQELAGAVRAFFDHYHWEVSPRNGPHWVTIDLRLLAEEVEIRLRAIPEDD
jgi:hypothetical protein